jgi:hypothetical protein
MGLTPHEINQALRVDDTSTVDVVYLGYSEVGAVDADPVWKIKKIVTTNGADITFADGDDNYDNVWDDRVSLTYS